MKAVMISIHPEWCEEILNGRKTLEIRKTKPRLKAPFKCFIYMTRGNASYPVEIGGAKYKCNVSGGQLVVGEFTCNSIEAFDVPYPAFQSEMRKDILERSCVDYYPLHRYAYHDTLYAWDISDLKVYEKPKPISDFYVEAPATTDYPILTKMKRPPQSWCYVEGLSNGL